MLKFVIAGLVGAIVWQCLIFAVAAVTNEDDDKTIIFAMAVPYFLFAYSGEKIFNIYQSSKYKALLVDPKGKLCYCNSRNEPEWLMKIGYDFAKELRNSYTFADGWKVTDGCLGAINLRYSPIKKIKEIGAYKVDKKTIMKAKSFL